MFTRLVDDLTENKTVLCNSTEEDSLSDCVYLTETRYLSLVPAK